MNDTTLKLLSLALWPKGDRVDGAQVYYLLDGARDQNISRLVRSGGLEYTCLFAEGLHPRLQAAAPYLVHLSAGSTTTNRLLQAGWARAWGIFVIAAPEITLAQLRLHFKKLLRVETEKREMLSFRFYDPRVLNIFIPTCTLEELQAFIGPLSKIIAEAPDGTSYHAYSREENRMLTAQYSISDVEQTTPINKTVGGRFSEHVGRRARMLTMRAEQLQILSNAPHKNFIDRLAAYLTRKYPENVPQSRFHLTQMISIGIQKASEYGMYREIEIARYLEYCVLFKTGFEEEIRYSRLNDVLIDDDLTPGEKLNTLDSLFNGYSRSNI